MGHLLDTVGDLLPDAALAATIWAGFCALAMVACAQPVRRCALARVALAGSLLIGPLVAWLPLPRLDIPELVGQVHSPRPRLEPARWLTPAQDRRTPQVVGNDRLVRRVVSAIALGGTAIGLGWVGLGCWAARRLASATRPAGPETLALAGQLFAPPRGRPAIRVSESIRRPVLAGAVRPVIVLPASLESADQRERLRLSLLHELAHAGRFDPFFGLLGALAQAAWFFVPPVWWVRAQMRLDQEFLADQRASTGFAPCATAYASSLVDLAGSPHLTVLERHPPGKGRSAPLGSALSLRVLMLVRCPFQVESRLPRRLWGLAPMAVAGLVLVCCLTVRAPASPQSGAEPTHGQLDVLRLSLSPATPPQSLSLVLPAPAVRVFELSFEIQATALELAGLSFAGYCIVAVDDPRSPADAWHLVRIVRGADGVHAWVDQRPAEARPSRSGGPAMSIQGWSDRPLAFRNLKLRW
jgi:hypothetical protein